MWFVIAYIVSVLLSGGGVIARYMDYRDSPYGNLDMFFAVATPFIPFVNLLVLCGIIDEYMRKKNF